MEPGLASPLGTAVPGSARHGSLVLKNRDIEPKSSWPRSGRTSVREWAELTVAQTNRSFGLIP